MTADVPITISIPPVDGFVGVGFTVSGSTTVGPLPIDDYWLVRVAPTTDDNITIQYGCKQAGGVSQFSVTIGNDVNCQLGLGIGSQGLAQGVAARLIVELRHANHVQVESFSIPVKWDGAGMLWKYGDDHAWGGTQVSGGFTPTDRTDLKSILAAVYRTWRGA